MRSGREHVPTGRDDVKAMSVCSRRDAREISINLKDFSVSYRWRDTDFRGACYGHSSSSGALRKTLLDWRGGVFIFNWPAVRPLQQWGGEMLRRERKE